VPVIASTRYRLQLLLASSRSLRVIAVPAFRFCHCSSTSFPHPTTVFTLPKGSSPRPVFVSSNPVPTERILWGRVAIGKCTSLGRSLGRGVDCLLFLVPASENLRELFIFGLPSSKRTHQRADFGKLEIPSSGGIARVP